MQRSIFHTLGKLFIRFISHSFNQLALVRHHTLHGVIHNIFATENNLCLFKPIQKFTHKTNTGRIGDCAKIIISEKKLLTCQRLA